MKKEEKTILKYLVEKELRAIQQEESEIIFPQLRIFKSIKEYEKHLKDLKKKLS
jgi:hypothetical protein